MKKNVGTRPRPRIRTRVEALQHRAEQAARAHVAGRNPDKNAERIIRIGKEMEALTAPPVVVEEPAPVVEPESEPAEAAA